MAIFDRLFLASALAHLAIFALASCDDRPRAPAYGDTGGSALVCPGDTQCPCSPDCPAPQFCGPTGTCTKPCVEDKDCSLHVSGESCIARARGQQGLCGVLCDGSGAGGCPRAGMPDAVCKHVQGADVCGYQ